MGKIRNTALILLSGGLDSVVSIPVSNCEIKLGLLFNYGQVSFKNEQKSALKIAEYYNFPLKIIKLDWLSEILNNGLTSNDNIYKLDSLDNKNELEKSMKSVWVPNRNALFINISASICEAKNIDKIIIGANLEEGETFKDNTKEFIDKCNQTLKYSTNNEVEVLAPLINMSKSQIVSVGLKHNIPLEYIYSCYYGGDVHCGYCESCLHLRNALIDNNREDLIKKLF